MIVLKEQIDIPAPFEKLCQWADNFETEFVKWSPYHLECELFDGGVKKGDRVRFYEIVMGLDYDVTGTIVESERDNDRFRFVFETAKRMAIITFEGMRTEQGCRFSHTEAFGLQTPVIGTIINFLIFNVIFRKKANWQLIRDDMILDNRLLSDILTKEIYPERISIEDLKKGKI
ncbi:MAG: SRPBCC family protein [Treponemataceae bacterium]